MSNQVQNLNLKSCREAHADALVELGKKDKKVMALTADVSPSTYYNKFAKEFPERFIECGVAEQNMMGVAAGLALSGKIPFLASYAVFSPGRNWDQLRVSVCYTKANVKIIGAHTGITVGPDGATHQALEDLAITRVLPNLIVLAPCDYEETYKATIAAYKHQGPVYIRFGREKTPILTDKKTPFKIGQANVLVAGRDVTIIGCGALLNEALAAAKELKSKKISVEVINCHTIKPLDKKTILTSVKKTQAVVVVEEHQITGGLGGAVAEMLAQNYPVPMEMIGVQDAFGESGEAEELLAKYHLKAKDIVVAIKKVLVRKGQN
ncbi:MAG: transketolase family protein [Patescibacteria group bacterium]